MTREPPRAGEFELIAPLFRAAGGRGARRAGPARRCRRADRRRAGHELVVTTDALVAGVHFLRRRPARPHRPQGAARQPLRSRRQGRACRAGYLLDARLSARSRRKPGSPRSRAACAADQREFGIHLVGGDTASTPGPLTLAITALGEVPRGGCCGAAARARATTSWSPARSATARSACSPPRAGWRTRAGDRAALVAALSPAAAAHGARAARWSALAHARRWMSPTAWSPISAISARPPSSAPMIEEAACRCRRPARAALAHAPRLHRPHPRRRRRLRDPVHGRRRDAAPASPPLAGARGCR